MPVVFDEGVRVHQSHLEILIHLGLPHPEDILQESRARHLLALTLHAPQEIWTLLHHDAQALRAYQEAVKWIWQACARDYHLAEPENWRAWNDMMCQRTTPWKRICAVAAKRWRNFRVLWAHVDKWKIDLHLELWNRKLWQVSIPQSTHRCLLCKMDFSQARGWFLHAHGKHNYRSLEGRATQGQYCPQCNRLYPTPLSLHHHLRYSASCRTYFWLQRGSVIQAPFDEANLHPQCPWIPGDANKPDEMVEPFDPDHDSLVENLTQALSTFTPPEDDTQLAQTLVEEVWTLLCAPLPFMTIVRAFETWQEPLMASEDEHLHHALDQIRDRLLQPHQGYSW